MEFVMNIMPLEAIPLVYYYLFSYHKYQHNVSANSEVRIKLTLSNIWS